MAEQWMSIVEYARAFGMSDMTVRRHIKTGKLNAVLKDNKYFIPVDLSQLRGAPAAASPAYPSEAPGPKRGPGEMQIIKGHPHAQKTYAQPQFDTRPPVMPEMPPPRHEPRHELRHETRHEPRHEPRHDFGAHDGGGEGVIPATLRRPLASQETSLVDTRALLAFCDATLRKLNENERRTIEKFKGKLEALEATLVGKDQEIRILRQKVEDLQLLVKLLEKK